ncbi:hypothetical protein CVT26_015934 [Gymnopilus dilepis]|uniref:Uncharacterized protein n=1 Tax=Gymnopilus dilepis TaxID=231916 RepID=A0A409XYL8_9AGAR|nr:hypothetical protein CVT26_015934 [Gymnopilus dilepis]
MAVIKIRNIQDSNSFEYVAFVFVVVVDAVLFFFISQEAKVANEARRVLAINASSNQERDDLEDVALLRQTAIFWIGMVSLSGISALVNAGVGRFMVLPTTLTGCVDLLAFLGVCGVLIYVEVSTIMLQMELTSYVNPED